MRAKSGMLEEEGRRKEEGGGHQVCWRKKDGGRRGHQAMMETVSSTLSPRRASPVIPARAAASSLEMPFVNRRQAVSPSIVTVADGAIAAVSNSAQHEGSRTRDHNMGADCAPSTRVS